MARMISIAVLLVASSGVLAKGQQIHFLLVADTADNKLKDSCATTVRNVKSSLSYLIPEDRYSLTVIESRSQPYTADSVLVAIRKGEVGKDDTFVFLYDGHGARAQGHHFLRMPDGGRLWSAELQKTVESKPCRLRVVITNSCNVSVERGPIAAAPCAAEVWNVKQNGIAPVMEELFFNHRGLMHMNGAWPEQFGFGSDIDGGWLFSEFFAYCRACPTGRPTWRCMDRMMDRRLGQRFQEAFNGKFVEDGYTQTSLKTISWSYPTSVDHATSRFGAVGDDTLAGAGARVTRVERNSPASIALRTGDTVVSINGERIEDSVMFFDLVRSSPKDMVFEYQRGGMRYSAKTALRW